MSNRMKPIVINPFDVNPYKERFGSLTKPDFRKEIYNVGLEIKTSQKSLEEKIADLATLKFTILLQSAITLSVIAILIGYLITCQTSIIVISVWSMLLTSLILTVSQELSLRYKTQKEIFALEDRIRSLMNRRRVLSQEVALDTERNHYANIHL